MSRSFLVLCACLAVVFAATDGQRIDSLVEEMPVVSKTNNDQGVLLDASSRTDKCGVSLSDIKRICQHRGAKAMLSQLTSGDGDGDGDGEDDSLEPVTQYLGKFAYISQVDIGCSAQELSSFTKAIVIVHGAKRDAENYFCSMAENVQNAASHDLENTLVVAPRFPSKKGKRTLDLKSNTYTWDSGKGPGRDWKAGGITSYGRTMKSSSFAKLDKLVHALSDIPSIKSITVAGHSAGGQTVMRYALTSRIAPPSKGKRSRTLNAKLKRSSLGYTSLRDDVELNYLVANPSSYAYLDQRRWPYKCDERGCRQTGRLAVPEKEVLEGPNRDIYFPKKAKIRYGLGTKVSRGSKEKVDGQPESPPQNTGKWICRSDSYNEWQYGLKNAHEDVAFVPSPSDIKLAIEAYAARSVNYLVGEGDCCNDVIYRYSASYGRRCQKKCWKKNRGCQRTIMDARCPAMLQGPWRHWRGVKYYKYLRQYYRERRIRLRHTLRTVPGVGHEGGKMISSAEANHVFFHTQLRKGRGKMQTRRL